MRVRLLFSAGILLPALLLAGLAIRAIRQEQAQQGARLKARASQLGRLALREVDQGLEDLRRRVRRVRDHRARGWPALAYDASGKLRSPSLEPSRPEHPPAISATMAAALQWAEQLELRSRRPLRAVKLYRSGLQRATRDVDRYIFAVHLGRALRKTGDHRGAREAFARALPLAPSATARRMVQLILLRSGIDQQRQTGARTLADALRVALKAGSYDDADAFFLQEGLALLATVDPAAQSELALAQRALQRYQQAAIRLARKVAGTAPADILRLDDRTFLLVWKAQDRGRLLVAVPWREVSGVLKARLAPLREDRELALTFGPQARPGLLSLNSAALPGWSLHVEETESSRKARAGGGKVKLILGAIALALLAMIAGGWLSFRALDRQLALARLRSDFVSNVSHELRTPVASIRLMVETLKENRVPDEAARAEYYQIIVRESERLSRLVNNVLDFSRMEAGRKQFKLVETDLVPLVGRVVRALSDYHPDRVSFTHDEGPIRHPVDADALEQIVFNLLDNGLKYAQSVEVCLQQGDAQPPRLIVRDRGPGIPQEELGRIFDKFYRVGDALTQEIAGSGLGLALVKQMVEAHGGSISVESRLGEGTTFTVALV